MTITADIAADELIALRLMQAIRAHGEAACAPDLLDLISVTLDVSAAVTDPSQITCTPRIDRKTRSILFAGGTAETAGGIVMSATAVYRIRPAG
ncbi:hypothetical protein [Hyphomonas sp.]|uniref:hypothetical protein n=1 Tax=Hyphomonas sp. TaxID=87 RepID=UPI003918821B